MSNRATNFFTERINIFRNVVCQICVLASVPNLFDRIKLWRVRRKPFDADSSAKTSEQSLGSRTMNRPPVQNKDEPTRKMSQKLTCKYFKIVRTDVLALNVKIEFQPMTLRRNAERRNGRKAISSIPAIEDGRLPARRPCSANNRLEHKATFVKKYDVTPAFCRVFLYEASLCFATVRLLLRCILWHAVRAFGNSSREYSECAKPPKDRNEHRSNCILTRLHASGSTDGYCIRGLVGLSVVGEPAFCDVFPTVWALGRDAACLPKPLSPSSRKHPAIAQLNRGQHPPFGRPGGYRGFRRAARLPALDAVGVLVLFLLVSYIRMSVIQYLFL